MGFCSFKVRDFLGGEIPLRKSLKYHLDYIENITPTRNAGRCGATNYKKPDCRSDQKNKFAYHIVKDN